MIEIDIKNKPLKEIQELCLISDGYLDVENLIVRIEGGIDV